ncbi:hypothetical protein D1007_11973 [Hordeum vulgare]|nr:hypothetical protein D1007_11973 [Hordeum vulgare]
MRQFGLYQDIPPPVPRCIDEETHKMSNMGRSGVDWNAENIEWINQWNNKALQNIVPQQRTYDATTTEAYYNWLQKQKKADIESAMEQEVLESEEPKSVAAVVANILTKECPSSRFLQNVGLESTSKKKFNRSASALDAHVQELEYKLEKERQAAELMREELVEAKKKLEEADAARAAEYQLLLKRVEDTDARAKASDAKFARLIDPFEGKIV